MKEKNEAKRTLERVRSFRYKLILEGMAVGVLAGIVIVLFRLAINEAEKYAGMVHEMVREVGSPLVLALFFAGLLVLAALCTWMVKKEPMISGSGIPQLKGEMADRLETKWWRVLVFKFTGAAVTIGSGLSLGREGPSIQLGAMAGKGFARLTGKLHTEEKLLMTSGASAGLAAAFNAPFAGVMFSLEELHKNFSEEVLLCTMSAAITSDFVSRYVFGLEPIFAIDVPEMLPLKHYWLVIVLGAVLGATGVFYNYCINKAQNMYSHIDSRYVRIAVPFALAGVLALIYPHVLGGGSHLVDIIAADGFAFKALLVLFIVKFVFSMLSFGSGAPGGIFLPLLVLGSVLGGLFFGASNMALDLAGAAQLDTIFLQNFVIYGMAGFFAAIVRAPITGIVLISEMTGSLTNLLTLSIVSFTAYVVADLLKGKPIYNQLLERMMALREKGLASESAVEGKKVLVETPVYFGSPADCCLVSELHLPKGALIVSLTRGDVEVVPSGSTAIQGGDKLVIIVDSDQKAALEAVLDNVCRTIEL